MEISVPSSARSTTGAQVGGAGAKDVAAVEGRPWRLDVIDRVVELEGSGGASHHGDRRSQ